MSETKTSGTGSTSGTSSIVSKSGLKRSVRIAGLDPDPPKKLDSLGQEIKAAIEEELATSGRTRKGWKGFVEEIKYPTLTGEWSTYRDEASDAARIDVNKVGRIAGCHTCPTMAHTDKDQPWIGDHSPPTNLSERAREVLGCRDQTYLFPQCGPCSQKQSGLVSSLNKAAKYPGLLTEMISKLPEDKKLLLTGGKAPVPDGLKRNCIATDTDGVTDTQGKLIQHLGGTLNQGCHTCPAKFPQPYYNCDHVVPAAFVTESMRKLFIYLGIELPALRYRPQCVRCSTGQGGAVSGVWAKAIEYGQSVGIVFVETQM